MARAGPLIPLPILLFLIFVAVAAIALSAWRPIRQRRPWLLPETTALASLALIHLLFFWQPYRSPAQVPAGGGDLASFFFPIHAFAARHIQDGDFPFWSPHQYAGMPHLANFQTGSLYPPNLLSYLLADPYDYATLELLATLHFLLASIGVYLLARVLSVPRPGAVLAGAIFAYSGFMAAHLGHYSMLATASWAPFVLAAIVAIARYASWPAALGGALVLTMSVLGGHQPILLMSVTVAAVLALFELWRRVGSPAPSAWWTALRSPDSLGTLARYAFMALVAFGLSLPAVGPSLELASRSARDHLSYSEASEFAVEPVALIHMVVPTVFGSNPTDFWGAFSNTEIWGYTGVVALLVAAYAVAVRSTRTVKFWLLLAAASVLFLLGPFATVHGWAYAFLPGYDRIRAAGRAYMFVDLAVALLAGFGLIELTRERGTWSLRQISVTRWGLRGLAAALAVVALIVIPLFASRVLAVDDPGNRPVIALENVNLLALWLLLALGVGIAVYRRALAGAWLTLAVVAVILLDLFHATAPFNPTEEPILQGFEHPEVVAFLREREAEDVPFRIESASSLWQPDSARLYGFDDIGGLVDPMAIEGYLGYLNAARADRSSDSYRSLNVRYLIADEGAEPPDPALFEEAFRATPLVVWEYRDFRQRAWVEGDEAVQVVVDTSSPDELRLSLPDGFAGGTVVISQAYFPGWTAKANGESMEVQPYADALQMVMIPEGSTEVVLTYQPEHWWLWLAGAGVAALGWGAAAGWLLIRWYRGRQAGEGVVAWQPAR